MGINHFFDQCAFFMRFCAYAMQASSTVQTAATTYEGGRRELETFQFNEKMIRFTHITNKITNKTFIL
jgi:hypothetical protein